MQCGIGNMLSTPHAHTIYVDGKNTPEEMVRGAIRQGFVSIGLSEHGRQGFDEKYCLNEESERQYIRDVLRVRDQFSNAICVYLGIEADAMGIVDRTKFDYVIGSKHYLGNGEARFAVDGEYKDVVHGCETLYGGDWYALVQDYFSQFANYVAAENPDVIGHFDLVTKHNEGMRHFDETDERYQQAGISALNLMATTGAILEVNTGAMARGYRSAPYPSSVFLQHWHELGGRICLSSDCHDVEKLNFGYADAIKIIKQVGFETAWALSGDVSLFVEYPL